VKIFNGWCAPNKFGDPGDCGTAKFFAAKTLDAGKALVAPKNFGDPESWNRELVRGKTKNSLKICYTFFHEAP
jgi:hypothetical protein